MNELDLVKSLTAQASNKRNVMSTQTTTVIGEATSDSKDGKVFVDFSGESVSGNGEQSVEVDTTVSVKAGDIVRVSLVGDHAKNPCVTGVVGGGDRTDTEIAEVREIAERGGNPNAIVSITDYFYQTIQTQAPVQPTEASHEGWLTTEPIWGAEEEGNEWVSTRTVTAGGTITWTTPSQVQTYANVTVAKNAIMSEVSSTYTSQNTFNQTTREMNTAISQNASCIASKVSVGESGVEDISTTMLQNANGVHIYNGELEKGDTYAVIDSDSFDIKMAMNNEGGINDNSDEVIATFGEETQLINGENKMVISSESIYGEQLQSNKKAFNFNVNFDERWYHKTVTPEQLYLKDETTWPSSVMYYSDLTDNGYVYAMVYIPKQPLNMASHYYEWDWYPSITYSFKDANGASWTMSEQLRPEYWSDDDSIFEGYDPFWISPPRHELIRYIRVPGPRTVAGILGLLDTNPGSPTMPLSDIQLAKIEQPYYERVSNDIAGSGSIGTDSQALVPNSVALGEGVIAGRVGYRSYDGPLIAVGKYNNSTYASLDYVFAVGNGTDNQNRSNAFAVEKNGDVFISGKLWHFEGDGNRQPKHEFLETRYYEKVLMDTVIDSELTARNHTTVRLDISGDFAQVRLFNGATEVYTGVPQRVSKYYDFVPKPGGIVEYDIIAVRNNNSTDKGTWFSKQTIRANLRNRTYINGSSYTIQLIRQEFNLNNSCQSFSDPTITFQDNKATAGSNLTVPHRENVSINFQAVNTRYGQPRFTVIGRCYPGSAIENVVEC